MDDKKYPGLFIVEQLINHDMIKLRELDKQDNNALHLALIHEKPEVFQFLYERAKLKTNKTKKWPTFAEALMQTNSTGKMPLHIACQKCNTENEGIAMSLKDYLTELTSRFK